jgi:hypothetical protein
MLYRRVALVSLVLLFLMTGGVTLPVAMAQSKGEGGSRSDDQRCAPDRQGTG